MQGNYEQLKAAIAAVIKTNGNNEITGALMQQVLQSIVSQIGQNGTFAGIATPATNPGTPDQNVFYLASESGVYPNFAGYTLEAGHIAVFANAGGVWTASSIEVGSSAIGGFVALDSIADLPESPSDPHIGYLIGTHLYVYVGTGGDTADGKYQDCGEFKGQQGEQGEDGNGIVSIVKTSTSGLIDTYTITYDDGTTSTFNVTNGADGHDGVSLGEVAIVNNLTEGGSDKVLSAEMGKVLKDNVQTILNALGEYAFPNGKPSIDWGGMPYDAEVEYLQSTGTQVIDSGIVGNLNTEVEVSFKTTSTMAKAIAGSRGDNTNDINLYVDGSATMRFGNKSASGSFSPNTAYTFIANKTAFTINGTAKAINATNTFETPTNLYIFGNQNGQGAFILYYIKITKDGHLVRDFIPVRVGQVGYLYDKVSGQLFGNVGTGDFVLGNDKN